MNTLVTTDLHFSNNPRDSYRKAWAVKFLEVVKKYKVTTVLILGDLTEEKDRHSAELVNWIVNFIYTLSQLCRVYILQGNHDAVDPRHPFFGFLGLFKNVTWVDRPLAIDSPNGEGRQWLLLPFTKQFAIDWEEYDFTQYEYIFCHATFEGAITESGYTLEGGIPPSIFPKGTKVYSGDIHKPQRVGPVTYVGAPYTVDFGDDYKGRMLLIKKDKVTAIPSNVPQKRLIVAHYTEDGMLVDFDDELREGDIVKIKVCLDQKHHAAWPEIQEIMKQWAIDQKVNLYIIQPVVEQATATAKQAARIKRAHDDKQVVTEYANSRALDELTTKVGIKLLEKTQ